ncbi:hypothetical protein IU500_06600 [Nocardia terpenica]|uniref:hypothetical protein n=1 Tax=Nocardia terpenica TaxID=455432 RepID=UPI00189614FB|nr:hypothetical protein [Nocardia terpenica]MBF6060449.1 hypothetical protein [Nocardia terpenica]MBF6103709.1 hypothetical protein [Nocardia terpenica]MBF6111917.1 hypothetical protein [Nocardia terpenica]MBF6117930.1 hypothetical protein [Nocardia terpenica]MBF6155344.1 hypothetical protein [Nocardia terpenica]
MYRRFLSQGGPWNEFAEAWGYRYRMAPTGETTPDPAAFDSIRDWLRAVRLYQGMTRPRFATYVNLSCGRVSYMETRRITPPSVIVLRKIRDAVDMPNRILTEALRRTYVQYYGTEPVDSMDEILFWKLIGTPAGSRAERDLRNQLFDRHKLIAEKVARRWSRSPGHREELVQRCNETILFAILNHVPTRSFARYAYASCRGTMLQAYFEEKYPNLDRQTRYHVVRIDAYIRKRGINTGVASCAEISEALKIPPSKVETLVRLANIRTVSLDLPLCDEAGSYRQIAETTPAGFADIELSASIAAALVGLPSPETALQVIMLHLVEGIPLDQVAACVHLAVAEAASLVESATSRLRSALTDSE